MSYSDVSQSQAPTVSHYSVGISVTALTSGSTRVPTLASITTKTSIEKASPPREGAASYLLNLKRRLEEIELERKAFKMENLYVDDEVSFLAMYVTNMSDEMLEICNDLTKLGTSLK
jgi:hypothetical protein